MTIDLSTFPLSCIYTFIDESSKSAYIQFSLHNALKGMVDNVDALRRGIHDCRTLQDAYNRGCLELRVIEVFESIPQDIIARARCSFWFSHSGYTDMGSGYGSVVYRVRKHISNKSRYDRIPLVFVKLQSRSPMAIVLGVFETIREADEWLSLEYPVDLDMPVNHIRFCENDLTRDYHMKYGIRFIRFKEMRS